MARMVVMREGTCAGVSRARAWVGAMPRQSRGGLARCHASRARVPRLRLAPRTAVLAAAAENSWARRRGSPDDALFALLRSAGTAATARDARQQRTRVGRGGSAINYALRGSTFLFGATFGLGNLRNASLLSRGDVPGALPTPGDPS